MKAMGRVLVTAGLVLCVAVVTASAAGSSPKMSVEDLNARLGDPDVIVVDVRRGGAWEKSDLKIKGAVRENPSEVETWMDKYPKDKTLVLYCS